MIHNRKGNEKPLIRSHEGFGTDHEHDMSMVKEVLPITMTTDVRDLALRSIVRIAFLCSELGFWPFDHGMVESLTILKLVPWSKIFDKMIMVYQTNVK